MLSFRFYKPLEGGTAPFNPAPAGEVQLLPDIVDKFNQYLVKKTFWVPREVS